MIIVARTWHGSSGFFHPDAAEPVALANRLIIYPVRQVADGENH
jgi:hypothetical protein